MSMIFDLEFYDHVNTAKKMAQAIEKAKRKKRNLSSLTFKQQQQEQKNARKSRSSKGSKSSSALSPSSTKQRSFFFASNKSKKHSTDDQTASPTSSSSSSSLPKIKKSIKLPPEEHHKQGGNNQSVRMPRRNEDSLTAMDSSNVSIAAEEDEDPAVTGGSSCGEGSSCVSYNGDSSESAMVSLYSSTTLDEEQGAGAFRFHHSIAVGKCWEQIKLLPGYQIILTHLIVQQLQELDDTGAARKIMVNPSTQVQETLLLALDFFVSFVGPTDVLEDFHDEIMEIGHVLTDQAKINVRYLSAAVTQAIQMLVQEELEPLSTEQVEAWEIVLQHVTNFMMGTTTLSS
ncbi:hypothetical protein ACA910_004782 [Epithemia clementina (nom. ined.)]